MAGPSETHQDGTGQEHGPDQGSFLRRLERHTWRRLLAGFVVMVPLAVTYVILRLVVLNLDDVVRPWARGRLSILDFPGIGFVVVVVALYLVGVLVAGRIGGRALGWQHAILGRIPVIKTIYGVVRQTTEALAAPMEQQFSRVVLVEWPRPNMWALGFVTGHYRPPGGGDAERKVVVYIPTVPNPTSGNLAFVTADQVIDTHMSMEDAMKLVFSGGLVIPPACGLPRVEDQPKG